MYGWPRSTVLAEIGPREIKTGLGGNDVRSRGLLTVAGFGIARRLLRRGLSSPPAGAVSFGGAKVSREMVSLLTLLKALKAKGGDQKTKLFRFLNQIGARALRIQLGRVQEMAESSPDKFT